MVSSQQSIRRTENGSGPAPKGHKTIAQGFNPGLVVRTASALKAPPTPRMRGAIPTVRNIPVLQNSITPLTRIRGRRRGRERSASGVAPDGAAPVPVVRNLKRTRSSRFCRPFRANRVRVTNPGLKPWAMVSSRFAATSPNFPGRIPTPQIVQTETCRWLHGFDCSAFGA
jgi:hypothetical protein